MNLSSMLLSAPTFQTLMSLLIQKLVLVPGQLKFSKAWDTEDDFLDTTPEPPPSSQTQNQQDFPNFVATVQRYGISVQVVLPWQTHCFKT